MFREGPSHTPACAHMWDFRDPCSRKDSSVHWLSMRTLGGQVLRLKGPRAHTNITTHPLNCTRGHLTLCASSGIHLVLITVLPYTPDSDLEMQKSYLSLPLPPLPGQSNLKAGPLPAHTGFCANWERHPFPQDILFPPVGKLL